MGSQVQAVLVVTPVGMAALKFLISLLLIGSLEAARKLRRDRTPAAAHRDGKSLTNTFPFNAQDDHDHHHGHHEEDDHDHHHGHHEEHDKKIPSQSLSARDQRQGDADTSFGAVAAAGKKCIDKVEMVEETEYDDVVQCDHSYDKRCHTTYVTNYESQQEEECEENFRKSCFIEYEKIALQETVNICRKPLVKDCEVEGPEVCRTEYESECWTKEEKCDDIAEGYTTFTKCSKWPREVCSVEKKKVK